VAPLALGYKGKKADDRTGSSELNAAGKMGETLKIPEDRHFTYFFDYDAKMSYIGRLLLASSEAATGAEQPVRERAALHLHTAHQEHQVAAL
jgi:hypothetical protein